MVGSPADVNQINDYAGNTHGVVVGTGGIFETDSFFNILKPVEGLDGVRTIDWRDIWPVRPNPSGPAIVEVGRSQTLTASTDVALLQGNGDGEEIMSDEERGYNYRSTDDGKTWSRYDGDRPLPGYNQNIPRDVLKDDPYDDLPPEMEVALAASDSGVPVIMTGDEPEPEPEKPGASLVGYLEGKEEPEPEPEPAPAEPETFPGFKPGPFDGFPPGAFFDPFSPRYTPEGGFTPLWPVIPVQPEGGSTTPSDVVIETVTIRVTKGFSLIAGISADLGNAEKQLEGGASVPKVARDNAGLAGGIRFEW